MPGGIGRGSALRAIGHREAAERTLTLHQTHPDGAGAAIVPETGPERGTSRPERPLGQPWGEYQGQGE